MNPISFSFHSLVAAAAACALLIACGGGGSGVDGDAPSAPLDADAADASTLAQLDAILSAVDAAARDRGFPGVAQAASGKVPQNGGSVIQPGRFPGVTQTNLVANKPEFGAQQIEPELINPWGIAIRPAGLGGHFWFAAQGTAQSIQYVGDVGGTPLFQDALEVVDTLGPSTGVVFNPGSNFVITQPHANGSITNPAKFLFANASGTITAWTERAHPQGGFDHPADSVTVVDATARHSNFLGVAVSPDAKRLLAADFGAEAALRVYDAGFAEQASIANPFQTAAARQPDGFEAFNVQTLGSSVFAMYGRHVAPNPNAAPPAEGRLAEFDNEGRLMAIWRGRGLLNYPWGVALAPQGFGLYSGCLLVGNFGDGSVVAFHPRHRVALDYVRDASGDRIVIDGLWGLQFGNGASLGEANDLYFAAGPNREKDGLIGKLEANPQTQPALNGISLCS